MSMFKFEDFKINYDYIEIMKKYLKESQFIQLCKSYNTNHFILDSGFIFERILHKLSIGYLDITLEDNDSVGRQKLRSLGCEYKVYASLRLKNVPENFTYLRDNYEIVLIDIKESDYELFKTAMNTIINTAFNNRDISYFELLRTVLNLGYPETIKVVKLAKYPIKFNNYKNYMNNERDYLKIQNQIIETFIKENCLSDN